MNDAGFGQPWYAEDGPLSPVVLTTRVRLARNVEDAVFPLRIKSGDAERILSGVFRIFAEEEAYRSLQGIRLSDLDPLDRRMLYERGVLDASCGQESWRGLLFSEDGDLSVSVNVEDHVRISVFAPGLSAVQAFSRADAVDSFLQKNEFLCKTAIRLPDVFYRRHGYRNESFRRGFPSRAFPFRSLRTGCTGMPGVRFSCARVLRQFRRKTVYGLDVSDFPDGCLR